MIDKARTAVAQAAAGLRRGFTSSASSASRGAVAGDARAVTVPVGASVP